MTGGLVVIGICVYYGCKEIAAAIRSLKGENK